VSATDTKIPTEYEARQEWLKVASDDQLVDEAYTLVRGKHADAMYSVLAEIFERHLPQSAWHNTVKDYVGDGEGSRHHLEGARASMIERAAARIVAHCSIDEAVAS
jgi:hypothetical protein